MSVALIGLMLLCGVVAVRGGPLQGPGPVLSVTAPAWTARAAGNATFPVFLMRPDGSTAQVGRAVLRHPDTLTVILFPDLPPRALAETAVFLLPTDPRALWATVPRTSKEEIAARAQTLARRVHTQVMAVLGHPAFTEEYQPALRTLVSETAETIRTDPRLDLIDGVVNDLLRQDDVDALGETLMPVVLPELRRAVLEAMTPRWETLGSLVTSGRIDPAPFRDAAARVAANPALQRALLDLAGGLAGNERVWRIGALTADVFADALTRNPRFKPLISSLVNDPRFATELRRVEMEVTAFATGVFDLVVGRGARTETDPLAIQMLRYVLINRLGAVVVLAHEQDLYKIDIDRYRAPSRAVPAGPERIAS